MRISDWSSDVCSSDLGSGRRRGVQGQVEPGDQRHFREGRGVWLQVPAALRDRNGRSGRGRRSLRERRGSEGRQAAREGVESDGGAPRQGRSEEHTSELQSLMRISYAVFCLKKKKLARR